MTTFDERERAFEAKFSLDQELKFRAEARRNKLLGEWAAARLGLSGPAANAYVQDVIRADLARPHDGAYQKVRKDLQDRHIAVSDSELRTAMAELFHAAMRQIEEAAKAARG